MFQPDFCLVPSGRCSKLFFDHSSLTILPLSQSITSFAPIGNRELAPNIGAPLVSLTATASSGLRVSFTAQPASVCNIQSNMLAVTGAGTCTVSALQSGNADYAAAAPVSQTVNVNAALAQTITLGSQAPVETMVVDHVEKTPTEN